VSNSGFKYYLVILDDFTHYVWTFPLRHKSDVLGTFVSFHAFVQTQFQCSIACLQTDNSKEFDNHALRSFLAAHGMVLRLTCPYMSQQNGRAERVLHTLNDSLHMMLLHTSALLSFWPDALAIVTYLLNRRSCRTHNDLTPYQLLLSVPPYYSHLRVFGCRCYPNTTTTAPHKLVTHSLPCIFLGYPADTKGYKCYDLESR
jgi:transposase InsO family protein